jgi:hypothetical protein
LTLAAAVIHNPTPMRSNPLGKVLMVATIFFTGAACSSSNLPSEGGGNGMDGSVRLDGASILDGASVDVAVGIDVAGPAEDADFLTPEGDSGFVSGDGGVASGDGPTADNLSCKNPSFPVPCPPKDGVPTMCWSLGTVCSTITNCDGKFRSCRSPGHHVDCQMMRCLRDDMDGGVDGP